MRGFDASNRLFIATKLVIDNKVVLQIILQPFGQWYCVWKSVGNWTPNKLLILKDEPLCIPQFLLMISILENQITNVCQYHDVSYKSGVVSLLDVSYNKLRAINTIQRNWRECRYNPEYKMCSTVQIRNLEDIFKEKNKIMN